MITGKKAFQREAQPCQNAVIRILSTLNMLMLDEQAHDMQVSQVSRQGQNMASVEKRARDHAMWVRRIVRMTDEGQLM